MLFAWRHNTRQAAPCSSWGHFLLFSTDEKLHSTFFFYAFSALQEPPCDAGLSYLSWNVLGTATISSNRRPLSWLHDLSPRVYTQQMSLQDPPPNRKMLLVLRGTGVEGGMATMLQVKWGGEFWCCACLRDHWPRLMLQQQRRKIWASWIWAQRGFSVLFPPFCITIHTNPFSCRVAALTTEGKHSSVFSSNCLYFAGCLCWIFSVAQLCGCGSTRSFGQLRLN